MLLKDFIWKSLPIIEESLVIKKNSKSWRINGEYFRPAAECNFKPGTINFALAWFQQGMAVSSNN
jgi:hypothetical protein